MPKRNLDEGFDPDEIENSDPEGEQMFAEAGFEDAPGGGPVSSAPGLEETDKRPGGHGQKVAGVPEDRQRMGLITQFEEWENSILGYQNSKEYGRGMLLDIEAARRQAALPL